MRARLLAVLEWLTAWLTPGRRKALYAALSAAGAILVVLGVVTGSVVTGWVGLVDAVLSVAALLLASWKARRVDWTALYAVLAASAGALKVVGVITDGQASHILDVLAAATAAAPLLMAALRTSRQTPTGEPLEEYVARHGGLKPGALGVVVDLSVDQTSRVDKVFRRGYGSGVSKGSRG